MTNVRTKVRMSCGWSVSKETAGMMAKDSFNADDPLGGLPMLDALTDLPPTLGVGQVGQPEVQPTARPGAPDGW